MNLLVSLLFVVTAYTPGINPKMNGDFIDAYGFPVDRYTVACGAKYWAHVFIFEDVPGSQIRVCSDSVLGGEYNNHLDLAFVEEENRYKEALKFGRKNMKVSVITPDNFLKARGLNVPKTNKEKQS